MKNNTPDVLIKAKNNYCATRNYSIENKVSAACLPKKVCIDINRQNIKQRRKCFITSFYYYFSNYDAFVLVGHLKYIKIIAMKWRQQLQIIVFILAHIK